MVKQNHRVVEDSEQSMLQRNIKWTVDGEDVEMIIGKKIAQKIRKKIAQKIRKDNSGNSS